MDFAVNRGGSLLMFGGLDRLMSDGGSHLFMDSSIVVTSFVPVDEIVSDEDIE